MITASTHCPLFCISRLINSSLTKKIEPITNTAPIKKYDNFIPYLTKTLGLYFVLSCCCGKNGFGLLLTIPPLRAEFDVLWIVLPTTPPAACLAPFLLFKFDRASLTEFALPELEGSPALTLSARLNWFSAVFIPRLPSSFLPTSPPTLLATTSDIV